MLSPLLILGAAAGLLLLSGKGSQAGQRNSTTGVSGKKWLVELVGKSGAQGSYLVIAPANPPLHGEYPVLQFSQVGDSPIRQLVARFPAVPPDIYQAALKDFGIADKLGG